MHWCLPCSDAQAGCLWCCWRGCQVLHLIHVQLRLRKLKFWKQVTADCTRHCAKMHFVSIVIRFILGYFRCLDWTAKASCVYHRLLCAMHIYDVLESLWNFALTWPIPARMTGIWATMQTCNTQCFFLQLGLAIRTMIPLVYIIFLSFDVICKMQS
jgi:hypothetical protein